MNKEKLYSALDFIISYWGDEEVQQRVEILGDNYYYWIDPWEAKMLELAGIPEDEGWFENVTDFIYNFSNGLPFEWVDTDGNPVQVNSIGGFVNLCYDWWKKDTEASEGK